MNKRRVDRGRIVEYNNLWEEQKLLSFVYSFFAGNFDKIGYSVKATNLFSSEKPSIIAESAQNNNKDKNTILVDVMAGVTEESVEALIDNCFLKMKSSTASDNIDRVLVCHPKYLEMIRECSKRLGTEIVIWTVVPSEGRMYKSQGVHKDARLEEFLKTQHGSNVFNIFPHPYFPDLHPLIKFEFLSLNFNRKGVEGINKIIDSTVEMAYRLSIGYSRHEIRNDFSELIRTLTRIGVLNVKNNHVYFPRNRAKFERKFLKRYWEFVEKIEKVTLFDFESLF